MVEILNSIKSLGQAVFGSAETLFYEPVFWLVVAAFCIALFTNSKSRRKSATQQRKFAKGVQTLLDDLSNILLGLFNSVFDAAGVLLNFIKELNSLLFGSLHEARAYRLAAFGVIFLSSVSFYTTSQGLRPFVGIPFNYFISFGIQSAILIVDYKIIKDYKLRKEIKAQLRKDRIDDKEASGDAYFSWSGNLTARFTRCRKKADELRNIVKKMAPDNDTLNNASDDLVKLFQSDAAIFDLFGDHIDRTQLSAEMQTLLNDMERAASSAQNSGEARRNAVGTWLAERFKDIRETIDKATESSPAAQDALKDLLNDIDKQVNGIQSNRQNIIKPMVIYRESFSRIFRKKRKWVEAYRYSSGKIQEYYKFPHFLPLFIALAIFIFLSSTFSFSYIYNTTFQKKQPFENYHMTVRLCDAAVESYQTHLLTMSTSARATLDGFIQRLQKSGSYEMSANAYSNYYANEEERRSRSTTLEGLNPDDPNTQALRAIFDNQNLDEDEAQTKNRRKMALYREYLAFIELLSQTPLAQRALQSPQPEGAESKPGTEDGGDEPTGTTTVQELKQSELEDTIRANRGLVVTTENIIALLVDDSLDNDWDEIRRMALVYQNITEASTEFENYQAEAQKILSSKDTEEEKSKALLGQTTAFVDTLLARFARINQKDAVAFCDSLYEIKRDLSSHERFINKNTAEVETAMTMLVSAYAPKFMPLFCLFIALLIDTSTFAILFIRGIKNRARILDKQKVLLAKLLLKERDEREAAGPSPRTQLWIFLLTLGATVGLVFGTNISYVTANRGWLLFALWSALYLCVSLLAKLLTEAPSAASSSSGALLKERLKLIDNYYSHLAEELRRDFGKTQEQIDSCVRCEGLLIKEFPVYTLHIENDFRTLRGHIEQGAFPNWEALDAYVDNLRLALLALLRNEVLEDYFNGMCVDFLRSLTPSNAKEYGGFNYLLQKALDKCNERERLFAIYYESLYPTLLCISKAEADKKGFHMLINLLAGEELVHLEDGKFYIAPIFFRILDEILYLKILDDDFDFEDGDDVDTDLGMDDVIEAYIEAKYSNSQD